MTGGSIFSQRMDDEVFAAVNPEFGRTPTRRVDGLKDVLCPLLGIDRAVEQDSVFKEMVFYVDTLMLKNANGNDGFQISIPAMGVVFVRGEVEIASSEAVGTVNLRVIGVFVVV